jgi:hypothetical protein
MADFGEVFAVLEPVLEESADRLSVKVDTPVEYALVTRSASPFPQHEGQPMYFGSVRLGKAYVRFHRMALYMGPVVARSLSPALNKRMQGKACFSFRTTPEPELIAEAGLGEWSGKKWL